MSEPKWTKGPWRVDPAYPIDIQDSEGNELSTCLYDEKEGASYTIAGPIKADLSEAMANARLKATAPELYGQHEADITDIDMLIKAIKHDDPKRELLMRCEDIKRRKQKTMRKARGESGDD